MLKKILITNRGEITYRVIPRSRKMGIHAVEVYSDADKEARHVKLADEVVNSGHASSRDSYLRAEKLIAARTQTGAEAVHPGHGFLTENAGFTSAFAAPARGFIDDVILPHKTRKRICRSLVMFRDKKLENPWRKHGNILL